MNGPVMVDVAGQALNEEDREILGHPLTGGVILFARNYSEPAQVRELISDIHGITTPSLIVAVDQEGGRVQRFREGFTAIPPMAYFGCLYDKNPYLARQSAADCGWVLGSELRAVGVDLNFAPVIDLDHGCSAVIGDRAFHQQAAVVTRLATALLGGLRSAGIATCAKHFPGHGAVVADSHLELPLDSRAQQEIDEDMQPFQGLVQAGVEAVMTAHMVVECRDREPVSFSARWLREVLRSQLGFRGIIFSDDLSMKGAECEGGIVEKAQRALAAGCEFLPVCNDREAVSELYDSGLEAVENPRFATLRATRNVSDNYKNTRRYKTFIKSIPSKVPA